jgi:hypothetical protein
MKWLLLFTLGFAFSCKNVHVRVSPKPSGVLDSIFMAEGFDTALDYSNACLLYRGRPILKIGQNVKQLEGRISFKLDTNGKYGRYKQIVTDFISNDKFYSANLSTGAVDGILFFSATKDGRIFRLFGDWTIKGDMADTSGMEIIDYLRAKYFPCLPTGIKSGQILDVAHPNFIERFHLFASPDSADPDHGYFPHWSLDYTILLTK